MPDSPLFRDALQRTENCLSPGALQRQLDHPDPTLASHIDSCAFCKTEIELLRSFVQCDIPAEDEASVDAIVRRLHRGPRPVVVPRRHWLRFTALAAAAVLVAVGVGLQLHQSGQPPLRTPGNGPDVYRSQSVAIYSPSGDLQTPPTEVRWEPVRGAQNYHVRLLEVDGNELWNSTTTGAAIAFPSSIRALIVPAKTLLITVEAFNAANQKIAESQNIQFRILQKIYGR